MSNSSAIDRTCFTAHHACSICGSFAAAKNKADRKGIKPVPDSTDAYAELKRITDPAQAGTLKPWGRAVEALLAGYGIQIARKKDLAIQATLSFPTSTTNPAMAIGFRHLKTDGRLAEDLFVFEENVGLTRYYHGAQERMLPGYTGSRHTKIEVAKFLSELSS